MSDLPPMTIQTQTHLSALSLLIGSLLVTACSAPTEDVRVTTCKRLAVHLSQVADDVAWQEHREQLRGYEYAAISVASSEAGIKAVCRYEYDAEEETAETHVDPLSAYATVPYEMALNGRAVTAPDLYQAMNVLRLDAGKRLLERAKNWAGSVSSGVATTPY